MFLRIQEIRCDIGVGGEEDTQSIARLPGCSSKRAEHALEMIREAIELVLEVVQERRFNGDAAVGDLPLAETPALLVQEVREILEGRIEYGLPLAIEFAEVTIPVPVPA